MWWGFILFFGLPGAFVLVGAIIGFILLPFQHESLGEGFGLLIGGALALGFAWMLYRWVARRPGRPLTLRVCPAELTMLRRGVEPAVVRRNEVALVVVDSIGAQPDIDVYGPDRLIIGHWDTNWMKTPLRTVRALHKAGWPWALRDQAIMSGLSSRHHSKNAPAWVDEVLR